MSGPSTISWYGWSIAGVGDLNGDGHDELAVGAHDAYGPGSVHVYPGGPGGPSAIATPVLVPPLPADALGAFGYQVVGLGDLDGDGFDELGVIYDKAVNGLVAEAHLFRGGPAGPAAVADWVLGGTADSHASRLAAGGDLDGDGFDDLLLSVSTVNDANDGVWIYHGSARGPSAPVLLPYPDIAYGDLLGSVGDLDGDGLPEVFAKSNNGPALVYPSDGGVGVPAVGDGEASAFVGVPDVTGDGLGDLVVAYERSTGSSVFLFRGSDVTTVGAALPRVQSADPEDAFGSGLVWFGDTDGDGAGSLGIAAPSRSTPNAQYVGVIEAFAVDAAGIDVGAVEASWTATATNCAVGLEVTTGDFDGDGRVDLVTANSFLRGPLAARAGRAYVFLGANMIWTPRPPDETGDTGAPTDTGVPLTEGPGEDSGSEPAPEERGCGCGAGGASGGWLLAMAAALARRRRA